MVSEPERSFGKWQMATDNGPTRTFLLCQYIEGYYLWLDTLKREPLCSFNRGVIQSYSSSNFIIVYKHRGGFPPVGKT